MKTKQMVKRVEGIMALDALTRHAAEGLLKDFAFAAGEAHCPRPKETMAWMLQLTLQGRNSSNHEAIAVLTEDFVTNDVFSERISSMAREVFHATLQKTWAARALDAIQEFTPDPGSVNFIGDCNEKPYECQDDYVYQRGAPCSKQRRLFEAGGRRRPTPRERRFYRKEAISTNTGSYWCTKYFFILVTWTHKGQRLSFPLAFILQRPDQDTWRQHLQWLKDARDRLPGIRVSAVLLDRWYDVAPLRHALRALGMGSVIRLRSGEGDNWQYQDYSTGKSVYIVDALKDLANDITVPLRHENLLDREQKKWLVSRAKIVIAVIDEGAPPVKLYLRAAMTMVDGVPVMDYNHSIVVAMDLDESITDYMDLYRVRWRIEVNLRQADEIRGCPRASLINADDLQYVASLALLAWTNWVRISLLLRHGATHIRHLPLRRFTTRVVGSLILNRLAQLDPA